MAKYSPPKCHAAALCATVALDFAKKHPGSKAEKNALRHCFWSCCMAKNVGAPFAKDITDVHEWARVDADACDRASDLYNNDTGIDFGKDFRDNNPKGSCKSACKKALSDGKLALYPPLPGEKIDTRLCGEGGIYGLPTCVCYK